VNYIKKFLNFFNKHKIIIGINYHRIGVKLNDPFSGLHTVSFGLFKFQILLLNFFFKIVSLDDIRNGNIKTKINFFISFDDVPTISIQAFNWLNKKKLPFVICPNIKLTEENSSVSDKFRFSYQKIKKEDIENKIKKFLNEKQFLILKKGGLKKLYKSYTIDQREFENIFHENIFKNLKDDFLKNLNNSNYLNWEDIKKISKKNLIASHGNNHYDFFFLDYKEIVNELKVSKKVFEEKLNSKINTFAIPYGGYCQHLGIVMSEAAKQVGYDQILWTGTQGVIYNHNKNQIQHLFRINTPNNFITFLKSILVAIKNTRLLFKEDCKLTKLYEQKNNDFEIVKNPLISKIVAFENIIRPYRRYSSDNKFIENIYKNNPFREKLPYAYSLSRDDIVNSISYILYKNYIINKKIFKIAEHSGWRKINSLNTTENVKLYLQVSKVCKAFYHWKPSNFVKPGLIRSEHYFMFPIKEYFFKIKKYQIDNSLNFEIYNKCPDFIDFFLKDFNEKYYLTLERSIKFYKWRIDNYPIGTKMYFIKRNNDKITSFLVSQIYKNKAMIVDLIVNDLKESDLIIKRFINYCNDNKINNIKFATSNNKLIKKIEKTFEYRSSETESFIFIKKLVEEKILDKQELMKNETYETYVSGDVLIR
jgi:hypothetical protein